MSEEKKSSKRKEWWIGFLTSVLGTAIGVGLTFAVSKMVEDKKNKEAQRLTAMMVIDDIEKSLETLKHIKENEEELYGIYQYVTEHREQIESLSYDTLNNVYIYITDGSYLNTDQEFSEGGEKSFNSTQDTWMNLNDVSFIRNMEEFYKSRAMFKDALQTFFYWKKPVSKEESDEMLTASDMSRTLQDFISFLKGKMDEKRTRYYIELYPNRVQFYNQFIDEWTNLYEECMFLMNITPEDMKEFKERTTRRSHPAKERHIIGKWVFQASDDHTTEQEFRKDHTFVVREIYQLTHATFSGKALFTVSVEGTWSIKGDSVIIIYDPQSYSLNIDENGITYREEMRDSVKNILQMQVSPEILELGRQTLSDNPRRARATNIDLTGNRLELTNPDNETTHFRRTSW